MAENKTITSIALNTLLKNQSLYDSFFFNNSAPEIMTNETTFILHALNIKSPINAVPENPSANPYIVDDIV